MSNLSTPWTPFSASSVVDLTWVFHERSWALHDKEDMNRPYIYNEPYEASEPDFLLFPLSSAADRQ